MTFTLDPTYVYISVNVVLAALLLYNVNKINRMRDEVDSLWQQIALMAIASAGAFDKVEKKLNEKQSKEQGTGGHDS